MFLLVAFTLLVRGVFCSSRDDQVTWYSAPNYRGTWDLIISCILTLTICVWSALHLNVPPEDSRLRDRNLMRLRWIVVGIFAPELVVSTAFAQYLTASWLQEEIRKDAKYQNENSACNGISGQPSQEWSITQCYFAVMGGVVVQAGDCIEDSPQLSVTAEGVRLLSFLGRLPHIRESQIRDKSKADGLAKFLVVLQAGWMIIQTISRVQQDLPVTLLEINTCGHIICAFALYLLWWRKPLDVKDAFLILREDWVDPFVALMWMCSPISGDQSDEISEMRCMSYRTPTQRGTQDSSIVTAAEQPKAATEGSTSVKPHRTHFSVGSVGAKNPRKFIGPLGEYMIGSEGPSSSTPFDHDVSYILPDRTINISTEHQIFFEIQKDCHGLQHSLQYCRRAFSDCKSHEPLSEYVIARWSLANDLIDQLWNECERRPSYMDFFFTTSTLGIFVGEPIYIAHHITNFPGLSYLGSVNVHRDRLKTVAAFAGAAYGGLHLAAWNDFFPTTVERYLWISCSCATGITGLVLALFFLATNKIGKLEAAESRIRNSKKLRFFGKWVLIPLFMTARILIVVEAFVCLRRQPAAVYKTTEWSNYFPHL
ncbi:hypothetical protein P153DRAFT_48351 [Dothidotthia symphoricarpi CBS 119687]|uniref:Integral membrane protein n=1 Tax=Dothidotthia symphoricarpi CBS 119687 TaxID=1392245 RepID=A0A6A6AB75_9PLEO|nr:uncharacterized protein P153DRAFT_48351 [Dothidotthia symphoricarpi CBS 119687]KAF2128117.1 hypothetical protein P153DRAFT_48351 [Dothidotthia symphoricarpi CBS 119687]